MSAEPEPYVRDILDKFDNVRATPTGWTARCPAHHDRKNSLSLGIGDDGAVLVHCHVGCDTGMVLYHKGLRFQDLYPPRAETVRGNGHNPPRRAEPPPGDPRADDPPKPPARVIGTTRYEIRDPSGELKGVHGRKDYDDGTKSMWYERPDGSMGLGGVPKDELPLFGAHKLGTAPVVLVCEGEKAAQALRAMGVAAVGTVTGADGCPSDDNLRPLLGRSLVLWGDNDEPGVKHMDRIGASLRRLGQPANKLWRLDWPDAPAKGDAADFTARGGTKEMLNVLLKSAPRWEPAPDAGRSGVGGASTAPTQRATTQGAGGVSLGKEPSQATLLVQLAQQGDGELFHDLAGDVFMTFTTGGHRETWPLRNRNTREWLSRRFYTTHDKAPGGHALRDAFETLAGIARFDGECRPVFVRLAGHDDTIYVDLGDDAWQVAHVTPDGWDVVSAAACPVRFRRPNGLLPLPMPAPGGDIEALRRLVNVARDEDFALIVAWLLGALRPAGPYAMLCLTGEQGSAKSTLARTVRSLLDPNKVPLRTEPRDEGDLLIAATNGLLVCFDNVSHLSSGLSDALCRLATGGGLGKRALYTDADEVLLEAQRPVVLTAIESALTRGDAIDRALLVELAQMPETARRTEADVAADLAALRPALLGALLTAASTALRNWPTTKPDRLPRMADFARWVEAGAPAFGWQPGYFLQIYSGNRASADELALDALPIGAALRAFMAERREWEGTATQLLTALGDISGDATKERGWPKRAHTLSGQLKRLAPHLRRLGIDAEFGLRVGRSGRRVLRLSQNGGKERQQRQQRQFSHDGADGSDAPSVSADTASVSTRREVSAECQYDHDENPRYDADSRQMSGHADTTDAADADFTLHSQDELFDLPESGDPDRWTR